MVMEKLVGPPVRRTAEAAASEHSMNNIRNIVLACAAYTRTHEGEWPDNLHVLLDPKLLSTDRFFRNPRRPELAVGYVLVKPSKKAVEAGANETVVIYEAYDAWPQGGINVGFADGHVQLMTDEAAFKKRLGESIDGPARP